MAYMYMYTNIYVHEYLAKMHCNFFFLIFWLTYHSYAKIKIKKPKTKYFTWCLRYVLAYKLKCYEQR